MNIVLTGFRGTGKSTLSRLLGRELKRRVISIDQLIADSAGCPIPKIVEEWGWDRFREMESRIIEEVTARENHRIIDCGGGVVLNDENVRNLRENGRIVLLTADLNTIMKRIRHDPNRPPLKDGMTFEEEQKKVLKERQEKYNDSADYICDTTHEKAMDTVRKIIQHFQSKGWIE